MTHPEGRSGEFFEPTRWSVILAAAQDETAPETAHAALTHLCQTYWAPLYSFVRSRGHSVYDAQDLTQGFFAHVLEHRIYERTDRARGKFRVFLLTAMTNFLHNARDRERALKRGGACEFLPLHEEWAVAAETLFQSSAGLNDGVSEDRFSSGNGLRHSSGRYFVNSRTSSPPRARGNCFRR